jgi:hypothetical protein
MTSLLSQLRPAPRDGCAVIACLVIWAALAMPGNADTFIFHDLTDVITVERIGTGPTLFSPTGHFLPNPGVAEYATFTLNRNDGTRIVSPSSVATGIDTGILILGPGEPFSPPISMGSDVLVWTGLGEAPCAVGDFTCSVSFGFFSDVDNPPPGASFPGFPYSPVGTMTEDGSVQTALNVVWSDGTVDIIKFESDNDVPEPSSLLLALTSFLLAGAARHRSRLLRLRD